MHALKRAHRAALWSFPPPNSVVRIIPFFQLFLLKTLPTAYNKTAFESHVMKLACLVGPEAGTGGSKRRRLASTKSSDEKRAAADTRNKGEKQR